MSGLNPNFSKRDYLLPLGCKDLIDVLNLEKTKSSMQKSWVSCEPIAKKRSPKEGTTVELNAVVQVKELADILVIKPFRIIADLMEMGVFANLKDKVEFDVAVKILALYGVFARRIS